MSLFGRAYGSADRCDDHLGPLGDVDRPAGNDDRRLPNPRESFPSDTLAIEAGTSVMPAAEALPTVPLENYWGGDAINNWNTSGLIPAAVL